MIESSDASLLKFEQRTHFVNRGREVLDECLIYFRQALANPTSVPPWSIWWESNVEVVQRVFPPLDYVRLKHRRLRGAMQILQNRGELPENYVPPSPLITGSCAECGERVTNHRGGVGGGYLSCPTCGVVCNYDTRPPRCV